MMMSDNDSFLIEWENPTNTTIRGTTCYLNSLVQALYMTPEVRNAVYQLDYVPEEEEDVIEEVQPDVVDYSKFDFFTQCLEMGFPEELVSKCFAKFVSRDATSITSNNQERILQYLFDPPMEDEVIPLSGPTGSSDSLTDESSNRKGYEIVPVDYFEKNQMTTDVSSDSSNTNSQQQTQVKKKKKLRSIPAVLQTLFAQMQASTVQSISTEALTQSFGWESKHVVQQHDVQELNRVLFHAFEKKKHKLEVVKQSYSGKFVSKIKCTRCGKVNGIEEEFYDITLTVTKSLEDSLAEYCRIEEMKGADQYECESCNKVDAEKWISIRAPPDIIQFSLNRFSYDWKKGTREKIDMEMSFPVDGLDLTKFTENPALDSVGNLYDLFGVIIHDGSPYAGHYHCLLRDTLKEGSHPKSVDHYDPTDCEWYDFNDSTVTAISKDEIKQYFGGSRESAYMLIYRRRNLPPVSISEIPAPLVLEIQQENDKIAKELEAYLVEQEEERKKRDREERMYSLHVHLPDDFIMGFNLRLERRIVSYRGQYAYLNLENGCDLASLALVICENFQCTDEQFAIFVLAPDYEHRYYRLISQLDITSPITLAEHPYINNHVHLLFMPASEKPRWYTSSLKIRIYTSEEFSYRSISINPLAPLSSLFGILRGETNLEEFDAYQLFLSSDSRYDKHLAVPKKIEESDCPIIFALLDCGERDSTSCLGVEPMLRDGDESLILQQYINQSIDPSIVVQVSSELAFKTSLLIPLSSTLLELKKQLCKRIPQLAEVDQVDEQFAAKQIVFKRQDNDSDFDSDEDEEKLLLDCKENDSTLRYLHFRNYEELQLIIVESEEEIERQKQQLHSISFVEIIPFTIWGDDFGNEYKLGNRYELQLSLTTDLRKCKEEIGKLRKTPEYSDIYNYRFRKIANRSLVGSIFYDERKQLKQIFKKHRDDQQKAIYVELGMPPVQDLITLYLYIVSDWPPKNETFAVTYGSDHISFLTKMQASSQWTVNTLRQKIFDNIGSLHQPVETVDQVWIRDLSNDTLDNSKRVSKLYNYPMFMSKTLSKLHWYNDKKIAIKLLQPQEVAYYQPQLNQVQKKSPPVLLTLRIRNNKIFSSGIELLLDINAEFWANTNTFKSALLEAIFQHPDENFLTEAKQSILSLDLSEIVFMKYSFYDATYVVLGELTENETTTEQTEVNEIQTTQGTVTSEQTHGENAKQQTNGKNVLKRYGLRDGEIIVLTTRAELKAEEESFTRRLVSLEEQRHRELRNEVSKKEDFWDAVPTSSKAAEVPLKIFTFDEDDDE